MKGSAESSSCVPGRLRVADSLPSQTNLCSGALEHGNHWTAEFTNGLANTKGFSGSRHSCAPRWTPLMREDAIWCGGGLGGGERGGEGGGGEGGGGSGDGGGGGGDGGGGGRGGGEGGGEGGGGGDA